MQMLFSPVGNDNKHSPTRNNFILTARDPRGLLQPPGQREPWHSFLQGLIDRGIGVESRGAGLHEFGRVMWGNRTQSAGGCSVRDAGHDCHHLCDLLFEVLDLLILLDDLPCKQQITALRTSGCAPSTSSPGAHIVPFSSLTPLRSPPVPLLFCAQSCV